MKDLLGNWPAVSQRLRGADRLLLMLDFDGTLAPIVPHPPDARIPPVAMSALRALRTHPKVELAIISGRAASDVRSLVGLAGIHYFGSHGREQISPEGGPVIAEDRGRAAIELLCKRLGSKLASVPGFQIENKGLSAAAHYRNARARDHEFIRRSVSEAVRASGGLKMSPGKMVYDITPTDGIDKGTAATGLFRRYGGLPLYFGDDTTDESVFAALPSASITVFVGPAGATSQARYRVDDPQQVSDALSRILAAASR